MASPFYVWRSRYGRDEQWSKSGWSPVESECGAVAVGRTYLLPPLSFGGASLVRPWLRFHTPLIEPDVQISRIRLSDKTSRLRPLLAAPTRGQAYETVNARRGARVDKFRPCVAC